MSKTQTFEEAFARLNEITEKLEDANLPLSEMTGLYTEGQKLYAYCKELLDTTEKEIITLQGEATDGSGE